MHLAHAGLVFEELEKYGFCPDVRWKNRYLLGSLLPDTKARNDKKESHFRNRRDEVKLAIPPDLQLFYRKYGRSSTEPSMLGYRMHLQLDADWVNRFWDRILELLGEDGRREELAERITKVRILHGGRVVPVDSFFSDEFYYGDFSRMNAYFMKNFPVCIPEYEDGTCDVREAEWQDLKGVLAEIRRLSLNVSMEDVAELQVFDLPELETFLRTDASLCAAQILELLGHGSRK
jgi:hypothetical protein